jgi:hypothetical protein
MSPRYHVFPAVVALLALASGVGGSALGGPPNAGARKRVAAWEKRLAKGWRVTSRTTVAGFEYALAEGHGDASAVLATDEGEVDGPFGGDTRIVVPASLVDVGDLDGDGRRDVATSTAGLQGDSAVYLRGPKGPNLAWNLPGSTVARATYKGKPALIASVPETIDGANGSVELCVYWNGREITQNQPLPQECKKN